MKKLLVVDDDSAMRGLLCLRLSDQYQVFDTGDPEQALALALEHKPDAILLDLMMPKFSGFELRNSFRALSNTSRLPIFVITGQASAQYSEECQNLGAAGFFQKPVDFARLRATLEIELANQQPDRRAEARVRMKLVLRLRGTDTSGKQFEELAETKNVSASGFLCVCARPLLTGDALDVYRTGGSDRYVGQARVVRKDSYSLPCDCYGFKFVGQTLNWVLHRDSDQQS